ncbi:DUF2059 domain-containing protein [uncultured Cohaesibacter sp.]|uniref:DUF2059 domain-containing protein n=1 Tax=uncultured Cohaesibacter sp. TaxID=1002546 RepID=UPI002930A380|nr:DUF2059 domain-containing protein [uncultured Cohaesibacter sp.]
MKRTALASILGASMICASVVMPALAQDAKQTTPEVDTHLEAAVAVVKQTNTVPGYAALYKNIVLNSKKWLIRENPSAEKDIIATVDEIAKKYENEEDQLLSSVAVAWTRYLKEDELNEVLAFFKTPVGQKFANYQPRIIGESLRGVQEFSAVFTNVIVTEAKEELNKKGYKFSK